MATYVFLEAQIERYADIGDTVDSLAEFSAGTPTVDYAGRMVFNEKGEEVFAFGKYKGRRVEDVLRDDPSYYSWMMNGDFPLYTKKVLTEIRLRMKS